MFRIPKNLRRQSRRVLRPLRFPKATLIYACQYRPPENSFSDPERARKILDYLLYEGCITSHQVTHPRWAAMDQMMRVHPFEYLSTVHDQEQIDRVFGEGFQEEEAEEFIRMQRWMVGGTIRAARTALNLLSTRTVFNIGGGFHHAYADAGYGFCAFNDVAIAIAELRASGYDRRILVVDFDLHQGDGTREIFANDPSVFTYSIHAEDWSTVEIEHDLNISLGSGIRDAVYLETIRETLPKAFERARPHLVFYLCGADVAADDRLGGWRISADAIFERDRMVHEAIGRRPSVWLLAGGYGPEAWRFPARTLAYLTAGIEDRIHSTTERQMYRFRRIARKLSSSELSCESPNESEDLFTITEEDLSFGTNTKSSRFLNYYTVYGLELSFEHYGIAEHIRALGYPGFQFTLDLNTPTGQMARVYSTDEARDLLIEIVLDERLDMPGFRLLWLEWLLCQNPRNINPSRPLLPGQQHPGLGCLAKVVGLLFMACDRLGYDGIAFHPAHYHSSWIAKGWGVHARPEDEARYLAIEAATTGLSLEQATRLVGKEGLVNAWDGGRVKWKPARMILPWSKSLRRHLNGEEFAASVQEELSCYQLLRPRRSNDTLGSASGEYEIFDPE